MTSILHGRYDIDQTKPKIGNKSDVTRPDRAPKSGLSLPEPGGSGSLEHPFVVADRRAQEKLGPPPARPKHWVRDYFWRGFESAVSQGWFDEACYVQQTCVNTVRAYFVATLQDSNRNGKDVWTGLAKIADRMGCSRRTAQRARAVVRECGFEQGVLRRWINPATDAWCSASTRIRFLVPAVFEGSIRKSKQDAAAKGRLVKPKAVYEPAKPASKPKRANPGVQEPPTYPEFDGVESYERPPAQDRKRIVAEARKAIDKARGRDPG